jgi:hypothetical protein
MLIKAFAGLLINSLRNKQKDIEAIANKEQAILELKERARRYFLAHVTKTVADEYIENSKSYIKSLALMELEIDIPPKQVQDILYRFTDTLETFETQFEQKVPNAISTETILKTLPPRDKKILGGKMSTSQISPSLAFINKTLAKPAEYQPYLIRAHQQKLVEAEALKMWNDLLERNF